MIRLLPLLLLILNIQESFAKTERSKTVVRKLLATHQIIDPGLYEIISPDTGSVIYLYKDRSGRTNLEVVPSAFKSTNTKRK